MENLHFWLFAWVLLNFAVFIAAGRFFFDASRAEWPSRIFVAVYLILFLATAYLQYCYPRREVLHLSIAGCFLLVSLVLFFFALNTTLRRPFTVIFSPDAPTSIVTSGPYRFVRHPFYTSYLLTFFASSLSSCHILSWPCSGTAVIIYYAAARMEEKKFAQSELSSAYADFRGKTGMFLPRLMRVKFWKETIR